MLEELRRRWLEALSHRGVCPACGSGRVQHDGTRIRAASLQIEGTVTYVPEIPERRLRCAACRKRWFVAPDGVHARAHYQPCVVAHAIAALGTEPGASATAVAAAHGCDRRTLGRWVERVAELAEPADIAAAIVEDADAPVLPAVPTELARPVASPRTGARRLRALQLLVLLDALASLRALEPPALAHAAVLLPRIPASAQCLRIRGDPSSQA